MDWSYPPAGFRFILFERINPAQNEYRFYYLAWSATLLDAGAVVRVYGRRGGAQQVLVPQPFPSLHEAWPLIRAVIKTRLRHGYRICLPLEYADRDGHLQSKFRFL